MKLYLVYKNIPPDKTHKIELLLKRCIELDDDFIDLKEADILSEYAVELRYPDDFSVPSEEEAREAYLLAMKVKNFVEQKVFNGDSQ